MDLDVPADNSVKIKESEKLDKYMNFAGELEKALGHEVDGDINCCCCSWNGLQMLEKRTEGIGNQIKNGNHPNYSIVEITQDTEKSSEDLKWLAVTQTLVEDPQLKPFWKPRKE